MKSDDKAHSAAKNDSSDDLSKTERDEDSLETEKHVPPKPKDVLQELGEVHVGVDRERPSRKRYIPRSFIVFVIVVTLFFVGSAAFAVYTYFNQPISAPSVVGKTVGEATTYLRQQDVLVGKISRKASSQPKGVVISQNPSAGESIQADTPINLTISAGQDVTLVPDILGVSESAAVGTLFREGIPYEINYVVSTEESGTVITVDPTVGTEIEEGATVTISVALSSGVTQSVVPFNMSGITVVLDPDLTLASSARDVPLEVANKLQGLIEASGGRAIMTRSTLTKEDTFTPELRKKSITQAHPNVSVIFTVGKSGPAGLQALYSNGPASPNVQSSSALATALVQNLDGYDYPARAGASGEDPLGLGDSGVWLQYVLGNANLRSDASRFTDDDFMVHAARALYVAIGQQLKLPLRR